MIVATPSGVTLAPEGGAHQSINTPLIGMAQDGLSYFEPAYADELAVILRHGLEHMQAKDGGGSIYLRLSTRSIDQLPREMTPDLEHDIIQGGYWLRRPEGNTPVAIAYCGALGPEALAAAHRLAERLPNVGLLAVTSPDRLHAGWTKAQRARMEGDRGAASHVERLMSSLPAGAGLVTVLDGHPATLSWLGGVSRHRIQPLGVERFGQSADLHDLYRLYGIDEDGIVRAAKVVID
jgi:pyruvate dehydrogenase E1 component